MKNLKCFKVINDIGNINNKPDALSLNSKTKILTINNNQITYNIPILLQNNSNCLYLFLNESNIVAVSPQHINFIHEILHKLEIGSVKVPQKSTQYLAAQFQQQNVYIHCGTFNYQHDCFIIVKFTGQPSIQIRNGINNILLSCSARQIQFVNEKQAIKTINNIFYFWKQFQYQEIKLKMAQLANKFIAEQVFYPISQMKQQNNQLQQSQIVQYKSNKAQSKNQGIFQKNIKQKLAQVKYTQNKMEIQKTIKKQLLNPDSNRKTIKKIYQSDQVQYQNHNRNKDNFLHKNQQVNIKPKKLIFDNENKIENKNIHNIEENKYMLSQNSKKIQIQIQNDNQIERFDRRMKQVQNYEIQNEMKDQKQQIKSQLVNWKALVCCQDQQNVIDVKLFQQKPFLFYHKFENQMSKESAKSIEICQLKQKMGPGQQWNLNPTKLIYYNSLQTVYYNDLNMGYIYSCDIYKGVQQAHYTYLPVLDMSMHNDSQILALHSNQIFLFDIRQCNKHVVANYKSVNDLAKISSIKDSHCFVTASASGFVRTYDIRNHQKALNKFDMPAGITSLQISKEGNYILCGYREKAEILSCTDRTNKSVFLSKTKKANRKKANSLIKGNENLSNIQFMHDSETEGDIIAVDDINIGNVVMKNVTMTTSTLTIPLQIQISKVQYLNSKGSCLVYGMNGSYFRQQIKQML